LERVTRIRGGNLRKGKKKSKEEGEEEGERSKKERKPQRDRKLLILETFS